MTRNSNSANQRELEQASPDQCDISSGVSLDEDGSGVPDECEAMLAVSAAGSRYIAITPPAAAVAMALRVTSPDWPCLDQYVRLEAGLGRLSDAPMYLTWDVWGIVYVGDAAIRPGTSYEVQVDVGDPGSPDLSPPVEVTTWIWGDVDGVGGASLQDLLIVLNQLSGDSEGIPIFQADLAGCIPDAAILLSDLLALLNALGGGAILLPATLSMMTRRRAIARAHRIVRSGAVCCGNVDVNVEWQRF